VVSLENYQNGFLYGLGSLHNPLAGERKVIYIYIDTTTMQSTDLVDGFDAITSIKVVPFGYGNYGGKIFYY